MTPLNSTELGMLLQHGDRMPVRGRLSRPRTPVGGDFFILLPGSPAVFADPEGLEYARHGLNLRLHRGDQEVLRRTPAASWHFPNAAPLPAYNPSPDIQLRTGLQLLLEPYRSWAEDYPLAIFQTEQASAVTVMGRAAIRIPLTPPDGAPHVVRSLGIDSEHGVLLGVELASERIEVTSISFPHSLPDPTWTGPLAPAATAPERRIPPPPSHPTVLRIHVGSSSQWQVINARVDTPIRLALRFDVDDAAPGPFDQTLRGQLVAPRDYLDNSLGAPRWMTRFLGWGWHARMHSSMPLSGEVEVSGVLRPDDWEEQPPSDLSVEKLFELRDGIWCPAEVFDPSGTKELLIDARPIRATTQVPRRGFRATQPATDQTHLWLMDTQLPVARCWAADSGKYDGQVLVPTKLRPGAVAMHLSGNGEGAVIANADGRCWELSAGTPLAVELSRSTSQSTSGALPDPMLPPGWKLDRWFEDQLFSAYALPPLKEAFQMAVGRIDPADPSALAQLCQIDDAGWALLQGFRLGGESYFTTGGGQFRVAADFELVEYQEWEQKRSNYRLFPGVAVLNSPTQLRFFARDSGAELSALKVPENSFLTPVKVLPEQLILLRHSRHIADERGCQPEALLRWAAVSGWSEVLLTAGPAEFSLPRPT